MKKRILIINQALNKSVLNLYVNLLSEIGKGILLTGSFKSQTIGNLQIINTPSHNPNNLLTRFISWIKYLFFINKWISKYNKQFDLSIVYTNPPVAPFYNYFLYKRKKLPYVLIVWDIYPDVIENMKIAFVLKPIFVFWKWLNSKVYNNAKTIITLGKFMAETMKNQVPNMKLDINIIPNWSDPDRIKPIPKKSNWFVREYGLENKFVILYSGKMGLGHDIYTILKAAKELESDNNIVFLLIGHGQGYKMTKYYIKTNNPSNIILLPLQPDKVFPYSIASADVGIVSQEKGMEKLFMPSKIYDMMSAGLAIIGISNGENDLKNTIEKYNCGININCKNYMKLKDNIVYLKNNKIIVNKYSSNSRDTIRYKLNNRIIVGKYKSILFGSNGSK